MKKISLQLFHLSITDSKGIEHAKELNKWMILFHVWGHGWAIGWGP